jgi:hypothetical protein
MAPLHGFQIIFTEGQRLGAVFDVAGRRDVFRAECAETRGFFFTLRQDERKRAENFFRCAAEPRPAAE